jgi:hypothetical protein
MQPHLLLLLLLLLTAFSSSAKRWQQHCACLLQRLCCRLLLLVHAQPNHAQQQPQLLSHRVSRLLQTYTCRLQALSVDLGRWQCTHRMLTGHSSRPNS